MRKKITAVILALVVITVTTYCKPIKAYGAVTSAGIGTYTASQVIMALLAMAGVAVSSSDIEMIWDSNGLDVDAFVNNAMTVSRGLGMGLQTIISNTVAGQQALTIDRAWWNSWKSYVASKAGTTIGTTNIFGEGKRELKALAPNQQLHCTFKYSHGLGNAQFTALANYPVLVFRRTQMYDGNPDIVQSYTYYFVPSTVMTQENVLNNASVTGSGPVTVDKSSAQISALNGWALVVSIGYAFGYTIQDLVETFPYYDLGVKTQEQALSIINNLVTEYRAGKGIYTEEDIEGTVVQGVGNEAATTAGQDVVGFSNTATQEEGEDVVIEGPLDVALPASATMEELLKQLAEQQITYQEYVQALALQAVDTKTETKAQVEAKQEAITVNPSSGVYMVSLKDLFPFCIPFDLYNIISAFNAEPVAPEVEITLPVSYNGSNFTWEDYTISLSDFDSVATVVRIFEYVLFIIGLMLITRKLIEG